MEFKFYVDKKNHTVVAKAVDPYKEYLEEFKNFYRKNNMTPDYSVWENFVEKEHSQIDKMVGISVCNTAAGDNFSENLGKKIAKERYLKIFEAYRIHLYTMIARKFSNIYTQAWIRAEKSRMRRLERDDKISDLLTRN